MLSWDLRDNSNHVGTQIATDDIAAERQRQATRPVEPPFAEVNDLLESLRSVGELAFVDQQPCVDDPVHHRLLNLIEGNHLKSNDGS